ncbi:transcriptional regulator, LysR family [Trichinella spiralis]|uniref:transcriptional regulator, LysR family n=1 Tax=Trichinella spiralis TaxID=6334 RepID=UPI0001EFED3D|nr:transcriptional regulator, LysR family [Trichinella spiralis]
MKVPVSKNQKTEKTAENNTAYHHFIKIRLPENMNEESLLGKFVQNNEARKVKCICGGNWKTVSVNQVELIGGLKQESEAWQKIIRRLVVCKQPQEQKTQTTLKCIWKSGMNHKAIK